MSADVVIRSEGLGKRYVIGSGERERYTAMRDVIARGVRDVCRTILGRGPPRSAACAAEEFWALRDVSFDVRQGEVLGVIGHNGAGKSTLLKILSRITEPTEGRLTISGRVASLLEVGTGFHPELTGRENIFLNGAVLGMTRSEIRARFDEIVGFAEVERFLDTPVKRYSSGMSVRLAFAVAAHLEPEILVVDEVLAVGDADFQKKCIGKMREVGRRGSTVLLVSHNLHTVERLCDRLLLLDAGRVQGVYEDVRQGLSAYLRGASDGARANWVRGDGRFDSRWLRIERMTVASTAPRSEIGAPFSNAYPIAIGIETVIPALDPSFDLGVAVYDSEGHALFWSFVRDMDHGFSIAPAGGPAKFRLDIPARLLNEGRYRVEAIAGLRGQRWLLEPGKAPAVEFEIKGGLSESIFWDHRRPGSFAPVLRWKAIEAVG